MAVSCDGEAEECALDSTIKHFATLDGELIRERIGCLWSPILNLQYRLCATSASCVANRT